MIISFDLTSKLVDQDNASRIELTCESLVDGHGGCVAALCTWLIGLHVGTVTISVGHIVHDANATVGTGQSVTSHSVSKGIALLVTERATCGSGLIVTERILAQIVLASILAALASVHGGRDQSWGHKVAG